MARDPVRGEWRLEYIEHSGGRDPGFARYIEQCRANGTTRGMFVGVPTFDRIVREPLVRRREEILNDEKWRGTELQARRAGRGMHEFMWSAGRVISPAGERILMLQIDGLDRSWRPESVDTYRLFVLAGIAVSSYAEGPLAESVRREALLEKLSPMRRRVAPLLATGMSETEIAEKLGRSRHTVHEHAKAIYQCWDVNSRHELRSLWLGLEEEPSADECGFANMAESGATDAPMKIPPESPSDEREQRRDGAVFIFDAALDDLEASTQTRGRGPASGSASGAPLRARRLR
jgi:DNA-binding CsgD family transcriptional regulator